MVDFGVPQSASIFDIGRMDDDFMKFPIQSINLCVLNLHPWNQRAWTDQDIRYVTKLLDFHSQNRYEMYIEVEMQPNLIFSSNLYSPLFDYAAMIISKGIARKKMSTEFLHYIKKMR